MSAASPTVFEPARQTKVYGEFDVVVFGGGPAGIAAAIAAGRAGRSTILVERYGFLGGAGTAAGLGNFCGLHANVHGEIRQVVHGIADDILARLERMGALRAPQNFANKISAQAYDLSCYKIAADELVSAASAKILFHALGVGAAMADERTIRALLIETKSGRLAVAGRLFIDCSGDADLAAWAGAPFEFGDGAGRCAYPSTMMRINAVDPDRAGDAGQIIPSLMAEAERDEGRRFPRKGAIVRPQRNPIEWRANVTQVKNADGSPVDGTNADQLSNGEIEGRRQCWETFQFIRGAAPGFEQAYIVDIAPQLGIRETRRIIGEYALSDADVLTCADFEDTIGVNGWPVEAHVAGEVVFRWPQIPQSRGFAQLPYRMILPRRVDNLLVAGRCASMTHEGQASARVSGPCFAMGEAAGMAAEIALRSGTPPRAIDVKLLQGRLEHEGVFLGRRW
ncbi:MAG TPA: FAD-dependent oxidoreductase [Xanthobacteraceae bacterium]